MELIIWRHAQAEEGSPDLARELTEKGHDDAARVSKWLRERLAPDTRILVSPARRTVQTADALGLDYELSEAIAPGASAEDVLRAADWPNALTPVMVVGHNPTLNEVAEHLLAHQNKLFALRKGAVVWFESQDDESGATKASVVAEISPSSLPD